MRAAFYKCAAAKKKKTCDKKAVRKQWLEDLVVSETMKLVEDDASMNAIIAKVMELQNQESTGLPIYEKQLKETEVGITNMLNAIQMGILTSSTKERLEALEEQRKELQARIAEERLAKPKMKEEFVRFWLLRFRKLDMTRPEQRQALVDTFINAIYLYDDKVLITFNYEDAKKQTLVKMSRIYDEILIGFQTASAVLHPGYTNLGTFSRKGALQSGVV